MKLLIEDYPYPAERVRGLLGDIHPHESAGICRISSVGYYYNPSIQDCVFILPKVILDFNEDATKETVFRRFSPIDIIDIGRTPDGIQLTDKERAFIYNLSTWIYRAISEFTRLDNEKPEAKRSHIVSRHSFSPVSLNGTDADATLIDIILSLIKFANENRDFIMFSIKNIHSGYNRINWNRTISRKTAYIHEDIPHHVETVNRKKQIDLDDELLVIFHSILNHLQVAYGFPIKAGIGYELIKGPKFETYLNGFGRARLQQIRHRYFSDKALHLWHLCYCFFARTEQIASHPGESEHLTVSDFDIVFETMVDELLSDKSVPAPLLTQRDGKKIDHIYPYRSLISNSDTYHIGDSKYYKIGGSVHGNSEYKQYTYVRNVIQFNLNLWQRYGDKAPGHGALHYLDPLTDGYDVTPNFFISSEINPDYDHTVHGIKPHKAHDNRSSFVNKHFDNRLFDRDTLWLSHYDINFLYILALFVSPDGNRRHDFQEEVRQCFRTHAIKLLNENYEFYRINIPPNKFKEFISCNFRELTGKIYSYGNTLVMALENDHEESENIKIHYSQLLDKFILE